MATQLATSSLNSSPDTYFYTLAQVSASHAVIGSDDALRIFDLPSLKPLHVVKPCNTGVSCLTAAPDGQLFFTAGRDARIRSFDPRTGAAGIELLEPRSCSFSALACRDHYIAAGTESTKEGLGDVSVLIYDSRKPGAPLRSYAESHADTVTDLVWHPTEPNLLLSGSTDGLVSIFDVDQADEDDALQQVLNPRSAVHRAGFLTHDQAYVLATDEQFSTYGLNKTGIPDDQALPTAEIGDLRPKLGCTYVVGLLQHLPAAGSILAHGNHERKTLTLTSLNQPEYSIGQSIDLPGGHGEEIVRDVRILDHKFVLSCGEDGNVKLWTTSLDRLHAPTGGDMETDDDVSPEESSKKKAKREKKEKSRFAPY